MLGYDHARVVEDEVEQLRRLPGEEVRRHEGEQAPVGRRPLFGLRNGALADVEADDEAAGAGERHHVVPLHELIARDQDSRQARACTDGDGLTAPHPGTSTVAASPEGSVPDLASWTTAGVGWPRSHGVTPSSQHRLHPSAHE
jgi:hypothetical protein